MDSALAHDEALRHDDLSLDDDQLALVNNRALFTSTLTNMQERGLAFCLLRERESRYAQYGGFVCDSLGTGKTLFMLSLMMMTLDAEKKRKTLVVAPASVLHTWKFEVERHLGPDVLRVGIYHGPNRHTNVERFWNANDVFITSYGTLAAELRYRTEYDQQHRQCGISVTFRPDSLLLHHKTGDEPNFHRIILDEAHHARTHTTRTSAAVMMLRDYAYCKWCVTATPVWNSIDDLWPLVRFLNAYPLADRLTWLAEMNERHFSYLHEVVPKLVHFLRPIMLRRDKRELNLPPRQETVVEVQLDDAERLFYDALYTNSRSKIDHLLKLETWLSNNPLIKTLKQRVHMNVMTIFLRMRQACVHPQIVLDAYGKLFAHLEKPLNIRELMMHAVERLKEECLEDDCSVCMSASPDHCAVPCGHRLCGNCFAIVESLRNERFRCPLCRGAIQKYAPIHEVLKEIEEEEENVEQIEVEAEWVRPSSKMRYIMDDMTKHPEGTKFVIFSQWTTVLDVFGRFLLEQHHPFLRIDGSKSIERRRDIQKQFTDTDEHSILLVSLMAGSEGLNLQRASVVYFTDAWWTAARVDQASNRVHRLGQLRDVTVIHLIAKDTIEERAFEIQSKKRKLGARIFGRGGGQQEEMMRFVFEL